MYLTTTEKDLVIGLLKPDKPYYFTTALYEGSSLYRTRVVRLWVSSEPITFDVDSQVFSADGVSQYDIITSDNTITLVDTDKPFNFTVVNDIFYTNAVGAPAPSLGPAADVKNNFSYFRFGAITGIFVFCSVVLARVLIGGR